mmetsp:Transcript_26641/g.66260  ORF Transcript_26641/g.66260 Transcript_26641/m.66260 type:complete len:219 (+) Transcript_26641:883-1539(+)
MQLLGRQAAVVLEQSANAREKSVEVLLIDVLGRARPVVFINEEERLVVSEVSVAEKRVESGVVGLLEGSCDRLLVNRCSPRNERFEDLPLSLARWPQGKNKLDCSLLRAAHVSLEARASACGIVNRQLKQTQLRRCPVIDLLGPPGAVAWHLHARESHLQHRIRPLVDEPRHATPRDVPPQNPTNQTLADVIRVGGKADAHRAVVEHHLTLVISSTSL